MRHKATLNGYHKSKKIRCRLQKANGTRCSDFLALHLLACMLPLPFHSSHSSNFSSNLRGFLQKKHMHPLPLHHYKSIHSFALFFSLEPLLPCNFYGLIWELQLLLLSSSSVFFLGGWKKGPERCYFIYPGHFSLIIFGPWELFDLCCKLGLAFLIYGTVWANTIYHLGYTIKFWQYIEHRF